MSYVKGQDPTTLREVVDVFACKERLAEIATWRSFPALLERVWLMKVIGKASEALSIAEEAVLVARTSGSRKDLLRARVLHATVLQRLGSFEIADQILASCASEAEVKGWTSLAAFTNQHRGNNYFDAGDYAAAREGFKKALFLRFESGADEQRIESVLLAIEAADRRRRDSGVGSSA